MTSEEERVCASGAWRSGGRLTGKRVPGAPTRIDKDDDDDDDSARSSARPSGSPVTNMATFTIQRLNAFLLWICFKGIVISYYAYVVETNKEKDEEYRPFCDVNEYVSCSKAFMSEYGKGFGLIPKDSPFYMPNSVFGIIFYTIVASLSLFNHYWNTALMLVLSIASTLISIYLARVLYIVKTICFVCVTTYFFNVLLTILSVKKIQEIKQVSSRKRKVK